MAKKAISKVKSGNKKTMAKVIVPIRSQKTGAYTFKSTIVPTDKVKSFINQTA